MYPSGGAGHFLHKILTDYFSSTVNAQTTTIAETGNAHSAKYIRTYHLPRFLRENPGKTYKDFDFQLELLEDVDVLNKTLVVLCDQGTRNDNTTWLLDRYPDAKAVRVYTPSVLAELMAVYNVQRKNNKFTYKNSILNDDTIKGLTDEQIIDAITITLEQEFSEYHSKYKEPINDSRVFNLDYLDFVNVDTFMNSMQEIAQFLDTEITDTNALKRQYCEYRDLQESFRYVTLSTDIDNDDLVGRALQNYNRKQT